MICKCGYQACGDEECDSCNELSCVGLCPCCHIEKGEKCHLCFKDLDMKNEKYIRTVAYSYYCNQYCYEKSNMRT